MVYKYHNKTYIDRFFRFCAKKSRDGCMFLYLLQKSRHEAITIVQIKIRRGEIPPLHYQMIIRPYMG